MIHPYWINSTLFIFDRQKEEAVYSFDKKKHNLIGTGIISNYKGLNVLISAKHLVENYKYISGALSFSEKLTENINIDLQLKEAQLEWHFHENTNVDIACTIINIPDENHLIESENWINFEELQSGSDISIIGYPLGLVFNDII